MQAAPNILSKQDIINQLNSISFSMLSKNRIRRDIKRKRTNSE